MSTDTRAVFAARYEAVAKHEFGDEDEPMDAAALHAAVDAGIKAEAAESGKPYRDATKAFFAKNEDLHRAYLDTPPPQKMARQE